MIVWSGSDGLVQINQQVVYQALCIDFTEFMIKFAMHKFVHAENEVSSYSMLWYLPRSQTPILGVNQTWAVVKGCLVSKCSGDLPEQLSGGQPWKYAAEKKWRPFFKMAATKNSYWPIVRIMFEWNLHSPCMGYNFRELNFLPYNTKFRGFGGDFYTNFGQNVWFFTIFPKIEFCITTYVVDCSSRTQPQLDVGWGTWEMRKTRVQQ